MLEKRLRKEIFSNLNKRQMKFIIMKKNLESKVLILLMRKLMCNNLPQKQ